MFLYIIWNAKPQLLDLGTFEIRYYSLLFALAFIIGYSIGLKMFKKEGYSQQLLDKLFIYVVLSTIIGARLGHCLFYEFDYYKNHILEIFLPWRGKIGEDFRFTGYQGLASHGAAIGVLIGIYLFYKKTKISYLWTLDKLAIVFALGGSFVRLGNLMNSEIYGRPTNSNKGFVFVHDFTKSLQHYNEKLVKTIDYQKVNDSYNQNIKAVPIFIDITLSNRINDTSEAKIFAENYFKSLLYRFSNNHQGDLNVFHPDLDHFSYKIDRHKNLYHIKAYIYGVPRFPTQIYEALSYLLIFIILLWLYYKKDFHYKNGFFTGMFFLLIFSARFIIEFFKENQELFEYSLPINMGQILSIPFIIAGLIIVFLTTKETKKITTN